MTNKHLELVLAFHGKKIIVNVGVKIVVGILQFTEISKFCLIYDNDDSTNPVLTFEFKEIGFVFSDGYEILNITLKT